MPREDDFFDGIVQADVDEVAPGMVDAIRQSLASEFKVGDFTARSVLVAGDGIVTVRWAVDCVDSIKEDRKNTLREITVHGLSLVGGPDGERVVAHYIDWAGVMAQLGMTTSRPSAVDAPAGTRN
jgi:hypothetical protein